MLSKQARNQEGITKGEVCRDRLCSITTYSPGQDPELVEGILLDTVQDSTEDFPQLEFFCGSDVVCGRPPPDLDDDSNTRQSGRPC